MNALRNTLHDERQFTCVECGALSPPVTDEAGSSMISLVHGWRFRRVRGAVEARCRACHDRFKASSKIPAAKPISGPPQALEGEPEPETNLAYGKISVATRFRSTWLSASLAALRERGLFERYLELLPATYRTAVEATVAGTWLPMDVALEHYGACDRLGLTTFDILEIGHHVTHRVHGAALRTFQTLGPTFGVTPWTALGRAQKLWHRSWDGGNVAVTRLGPKEARIGIAGWPCASVHYCRVACRGMLKAVVEPFCQAVYVREETASCGPSALGFVIAWA